MFKDKVMRRISQEVLFYILGLFSTKMVKMMEKSDDECGVPA